MGSGSWVRLGGKLGGKRTVGRGKVSGVAVGGVGPEGGRLGNIGGPVAWNAGRGKVCGGAVGSVGPDGGRLGNVGGPVE